MNSLCAFFPALHRTIFPKREGVNTKTKPGRYIHLDAKYFPTRDIRSWHIGYCAAPELHFFSAAHRGRRWQAAPG
jgi:hypothetical protein